MNDRYRRRAGVFLIASGVSILALGWWGLWHDVGWIAQPFYVFGWWGAILVLDGYTAVRRGDSLLTGRRRFVLPIVLWSVTFWFFFELLNLRFKNWYYVGVFDVATVGDALWSGAFVFLCFSTVFLGLFEMADALAASGAFRSWDRTAGTFPSWVSRAVQGVGALMAGLAVLFPHYLAPLIWGSLTFLVDPWNYRRGARSVLADFEDRRYGTVARFFLAGLLCGLLWESFNFLAPQKWIYTVRGLEELKLFEMPLLGFLGFPALAFDALAAWSLISYQLLGNRTWEHPGDVVRPLRPRPALSMRATLATLPLHAAFWGVVLYLLNQVNVGSVELELSDLRSLSPEAIGILEEHGIRRPRQLLRAAGDPATRERLRADLGLGAAETERMLEEAELLSFKGIGASHGLLLRLAGVERVGDLAGRRPEELHARLVDLAAATESPPPRLDMVRVWILAARSGGVVQVGE